MALGARNKFGAPMFEPEVFRSKCAVGESTCDIVGTFRRPPQWFGFTMVIRRLGNWTSLAPSLRLWLHV